MSQRAALLATVVAGMLLAASPAAASPPDPSGHCARLDRLNVPHAPVQQVACLDDLTTAGTVASGHTDPKDWAGLHATGTTNPSGVPGIQVDGYFPDTSTSNTHHGWNHDSQFVIRVPDHWNGGLVVTGAPGVRTQYANDFIVSDWVLAQGYAFASTDKGNSGAAFYQDGTRPGNAIAEWNFRVTQLTLAAKAVARQRYGRQPVHTYMFGISNGGYLSRWQLENRPGLYDGGVDWEGTLFTREHNLFTYLPTALRSYPAYQATGDQAAHDAMIDAGFAPGSEFLWDFHYGYYWDLTQRIYREEVDPAYDGDLQALTGRLGKPLLTVHGTLDALLPISTDSDVYDQMVDRAGRGSLHRYYRIEDGNHVDGLYTAFPDRLRPMLPCARTAFTALEAWTTTSTEPPSDATISDPRDA